MIMKKRIEIELVALELGFSPATIRKWFSRGKLSAVAQLKLNEHFGQPVVVKEFQVKPSLADCCLTFACR